MGEVWGEKNRGIGMRGFGGCWAGEVGFVGVPPTAPSQPRVGAGLYPGHKEKTQQGKKKNSSPCKRPGTNSAFLEKLKKNYLVLLFFLPP